MVQFPAATRAYLFLLFLNTTSTVGLDHRLHRCIQGAHSEVALRVPSTHSSSRQQRGWGSPGSGSSLVACAGGQGAHSTHLYIKLIRMSHVLNRGLCVFVCVFYLSTICDQFNGNFIYLKKKEETQIVTIKLIKAVYFYSQKWSYEVDVQSCRQQAKLISG